MRNVILGAAMAALVATPAFAEEVKIGKMKVDFFGQVKTQF